MAFSLRVGTNWCHDFPRLARDSGFYFNSRRSRVRVDWNRISNIDIERVIRERDFYTVDENVNNVIDYSLENEYDVKILDPNFVKLFRLAQLAVEYLLYCKQYLDHSVVILKDELRLKIEESVKLKREIASLEESNERLKEKAKERSKPIEARIADCNGEIHKCPHCPKTFVSGLFVSAHVARRHRYISEVSDACSPLHDQYRAETEKLHNEIKTLKERLNQTERVIIRNESERVSGSFSRNELPNGTSSLEQTLQKGYQEEINSLKSILLEEIQTLKRRERSVEEYASERSAQTLIGQQEREFQKLRNQLLERLTPDIEGMQTKLRSQEDLWRSKMEQLEHQHSRDIDKLREELKLTQRTADQLKTEYERKVTELERQTANQSSLLLEQSKQLHNLKQERMIVRDNDRGCEPSNESSQFVQVPRDADHKAAARRDTKISDRVIVENVDSVSSVESVEEAAPITRAKSQRKPVVPREQANPKYISVTKSVKSPNKAFDGAGVHSIKNNDKASESIEHVEDNSEEDHSISTEVSESPIALRETRLSDRLERSNPRSDFNARISAKVSTQERIGRTEKRKNVIKVSSNKKAKERAEPVPMLEDNTSLDTRSGSVSSESESESERSDTGSESESLETVRNGFLDEGKSNTRLPEKRLEVKRPSISEEQLRTDLRDAFDRKLRDLGIDPEWQGIPKATFKQKMDILKHHRTIAAKKLPKYEHVRSKLIDEILARISKKREDTADAKSIKKSPIGKLVKNVKSKAIKAVTGTKASNNHISTVNLHNMERLPRKLSIHEFLKNESQGETEPEIAKRSTDKATGKTRRSCSALDLVTPKISDYRNVDNGQRLGSAVSKSLESVKGTVEYKLNSAKSIQDVSNETDFMIDSSKKRTSTPIEDAFVKKSFDDRIVSSVRVESRGFLDSPKSSKSVLKSGTNSSVNLKVKKRVNFDLGEEQPREDGNKEESNDRFSYHNFTDGTENTERPDTGATKNIVLKTSQSGKIAEISRKIEEQLSMARQQPVGSVETMFSLSSFRQRIESSLDQQTDSSNGVTAVSHNDSATVRAAPRTLKQSPPDDSDLDSDIDEILKLE